MAIDPAATIEALSSAISGLLAAPVDPAFPSKIAILPDRTGLAGIGGFIGRSDEPPAERLARRLDGEVVVRVSAGSADDLLDAEARVTRDLIAADPILLRRRGILRLRRIADARHPPADGETAPFSQDLRFAVMFEHAPLPAQSEGVIETVPNDLVLAGLTRSGGFRYETEFLTDPLDDFTAFFAGGSGTEPVWTYHPAAPDADPGPELRQTGSRKGGTDGMSGNKAGAYLVLNEPAGGGKLADFILQAEVRSDDAGGLGLVFRFKDKDNFGFFLMEEGAANKLRLFGRREAGNGHLLAEGGQDPNRGFRTGEWLRLRLLAEGDRFELAINEAVALTGRDSNLQEPGLVGLFCRGNPTARFRHVRLTGL